LGPNSLGDILSLEFDILGIWKNVVQLEVLYIDASCSGYWSGDHIVDKALHGDEICRASGLVPWEVNQVASYSTSDLTGSALWSL
jgi:hypothetical protein